MSAFGGCTRKRGAVQRYLNTRRISSIRDFTLEVGIFPTTIILNWTHDQKIRRSGEHLKIPVIERGAQIIDGQHRRAGIAAAIRANPELREFQIPVAIFEDLSTAKCADIFISINTEQKPVPRSLVYDLFSEASDYIADLGVQRATDLARFLDEEDTSPYLQLIKFPGSRYERGGIALSTAVSALKPLVEEKGDFDQINIRNLEQQSQIILNFFRELSKPYGDEWLTAQNPFVYASGFTAAVEFLRKRVIPYCTKAKKFTPSVIAQCIGIDADSLILQSEVRGLGGKNAVSFIYERLNEAFALPDDEDHGFEL